MGTRKQTSLAIRQKAKQMTKPKSKPKTKITTTKRVVRTMAEQKPRVQIKFEHYTRTKQAFKDECNINNIVGQFMRTGQTAHVNSTPPQYGFHTGLDFRESLELITDAQSQFDSLPAKIRARFANDPAQYLDFATDSANLPEMREMGLALPKSGDPEMDASQAVSEAPETPPEGVPLPSKKTEK